MNPENAGRPREDGLRTPVTRSELERRSSKIGRRLLLMAWPLTTRGILDRLKVTSFSFSSEHDFLVVDMNVISIDVEREYQHRSIPYAYVRLSFLENRDGSVSVRTSLLELHDIWDDYSGRRLMNLADAYYLMTEPLR